MVSEWMSLIFPIFANPMCVCVCVVYITCNMDYMYNLNNFPLIISEVEHFFLFHRLFLLLNYLSLHFVHFLIGVLALLLFQDLVRDPTLHLGFISSLSSQLSESFSGAYIFINDLNRPL